MAACVTGTTCWRGTWRMALVYRCMTTPISSPATNSTYGRLSAPSWVMNCERVIGFRML